MAERVQRGRVQVGDRALGLAGQPGVQVGARAAAGGAGDLHRQLAAGGDAAGQHAGHRARALLAGEERLDGRGGVGVAAERVGPAGHDHHDDRGAGGQQPGEQVALHAGQRQVGRVAALAGGPAAEQPGAVADDGDHQVGVRGGGGGGREAGAVVPGDLAAAQHGELGVGELGVDRVGQRRGHQADPVLGVLRRGAGAEDVVGEGVAAEQHRRVVGARADQRDPRRWRAARPGERQRAAVGQQDHRGLGELAGDRAVGRRVQIHRLTGGQRRRHRRPVEVQQAVHRLLGEHAAGRPVDQGLVQRARLDQLLQLPVPGGVRQLHVDARGQRQRPGRTRGPRDPVHRLQERDGEVVGHDDPVEPPLPAQQVGEQRLVGGTGDAVDVGVAVHHRADALAHGHLERRQDHVGELTRTHRHRGVVAPGAGGGVPGEVLQRRVDTRRLQAADVGGRQDRHQVRVLAEGLLDAAPAVVTDDVEHRGQALVDADRVHVRADRDGHPLHQVRVERGRPRQRGRVGGRAEGGEAGQALLVHDRRHAEAVGGHQPRLQVADGGHALLGGQRGGAEDAGEVAQAVGEHGVEVDRAAGEHVRHRRDGVGLGVAPEPRAAQLGELLRQRHGREQGVHPLGDRAGRVPPGAVVPGACGGRGHRRPRSIGSAGARVPRGAEAVGHCIGELS